MSYHSYRNIGFVFTDTEANCVKWRAKFADYDPEKALRHLDAVLAEDGCVQITYLSRCYRLHRGSGILEKLLTDESVSDAARDPLLESTDAAGRIWTARLFMNEALVVYHILGDLSDEPGLTGEWVPEASLDPVSVRSGNRTDPLLQGFASDFSGKADLLRRCCTLCGGEPGKGGDVSFTFYPFPQTPLRLVFWDKDEDFPAQAQVYVDSGITGYMHFEAVGCMVADLFERIGSCRSMDL